MCCFFVDNFELFRFWEIYSINSSVLFEFGRELHVRNQLK